MQGNCEKKRYFLYNVGNLRILTCARAFLGASRQSEKTADRRGREHEKAEKQRGNALKAFFGVSAKKQGKQEENEHEEKSAQGAAEQCHAALAANGGKSGNERGKIERGEREGLGQRAGVGCGIADGCDREQENGGGKHAEHCPKPSALTDSEEGVIGRGGFPLGMGALSFDGFLFLHTHGGYLSFLFSNTV